MKICVQFSDKRYWGAAVELCGEEVRHKTFGKGKITQFRDDCISVLFAQSNEEKKFAYPSAFGVFLESDNQTLNKLVEEAKNEIAYREAEKKRISVYQEKLAASLKEMGEEATRLKKVKMKASSKVTKAKALKSKEGTSGSVE